MYHTTSIQHTVTDTKQCQVRFADHHHTGQHCRQRLRASPLLCYSGCRVSWSSLLEGLPHRCTPLRHLTHILPSHWQVCGCCIALHTQSNRGSQTGAPAVHSLAVAHECVAISCKAELQGITCLCEARIGRLQHVDATEVFLQLCNALLTDCAQTFS